ncbi:Uma2 family endonuclease [Azospirillum halopraeferens]|uniref:Uma2 family endonuclease n=1 Tax=Azospirillum halopraeferens TaxID=34010 RepID=UPI00048E0E14|nr:Uma2 family endonuclease [Azospirillum halopraeferens]
MANALRKPRLSPDEYLALERTAEVRHEYVDGEVFAMVGSSRRHGRIVMRLLTLLAPQADRRGCEITASDVKVHVEAANAYYYPDIVVACDPADDDPYVVRAPALIVEVLSDSTERTDRLERRAAYRTIPSLREYVLIAQDEPRVEIHRRTADGWEHEAVSDGSVTLTALDTAFAVDALYR